MANSKKPQSPKYSIALLQGGTVVALVVENETTQAIKARVYGVGRNQNDTGYVFVPVRFFRTPWVQKTSIIFLEEMPEEMRAAFDQFITTL